MTDFSNCILSPGYIYCPHVLPDDCVWIGAIASPDGYNGHAYMANVCKDPNGIFWVFATSGKFRIHLEEFHRKKVSDKALIGAPYNFRPVK